MPGGILPPSVDYSLISDKVWHLFVATKGRPDFLTVRAKSLFRLHCICSTAPQKIPFEDPRPQVAEFNHQSAAELTTILEDCKILLDELDQIYRLFCEKKGVVGLDDRDRLWRISWTLIRKSNVLDACLMDTYDACLRSPHCLREEKEHFERLMCRANALQNIELHIIEALESHIGSSLAALHQNDPENYDPEDLEEENLWNGFMDLLHREIRSDSEFWAICNDFWVEFIRDLIGAEVERFERCFGKSSQSRSYPRRNGGSERSRGPGKQPSRVGSRTSDFVSNITYQPRSVRFHASPGTAHTPHPGLLTPPSSDVSTVSSNPQRPGQQRGSTAGIQQPQYGAPPPPRANNAPRSNLSVESTNSASSSQSRRSKDVAVGRTPAPPDRTGRPAVGDEHARFRNGMPDVVGSSGDPGPSTGRRVRRKSIGGGQRPPLYSHTFDQSEYNDQSRLRAQERRKRRDSVSK